MPSPFDTEGIPRRVMPLIFMVDTSGSMGGAKIASLNTAVKEALNDVGEISKNNADAQIKVAALEFSSGADWMYDHLIEAESFQWQDLSAAGLTSFGAACAELNDKLSRSHGWMAEPTGTRAPAIILLSDGEPTDEWKHALEKLKGNQWFKVACKIAIAIGDFADKNVLADFTGNMESVITVHDVESLKKMIKAVSITSSMVNSQSASVRGNTAGGTTLNPDPTKQIIDQIKQDVDTDPSTKVDIGTSTDNQGTDIWDNWS